MSKNFSNEELDIIESATLKAISVIKLSPVDFEKRVAKCREYVKDELMSHRDDNVTDDNYCALFDEIVLRATSRVVTSLPNEHNLYNLLNQSKTDLNVLSDKTKFLSYTKTFFEWVTFALAWVSYVFNLCYYIHDNSENIIETYFTSIYSDFDCNVMQHKDMMAGNGLLVLVLLCSNTLNHNEEYSVVVDKSANFILHVYSHVSKPFGKGPSNSVDIRDLRVTPREDEVCKPSISETAQVNTFPANNKSEVEDNLFEEIFNLESTNVVSLGNEELPQDHERIVELVQEHLGSHVDLDIVLPRDSAVVVDKYILHGIDSTKQVDNDVLKEHGVMVEVKTDHLFKEVQSLIQMVGPVNVDVLPACFNKTQENEKIALMGRHINVTLPQHNKNFHNMRRRFMDSFLSKLDFDDIDNEIVSFQDWIDGQPTKKRTTYEHVRGQLNTIDFNKHKYHTRNFFIKLEVQVPPADAKLSTKAPRGIQGLVNASSSLYLGPFMGGVSKKLANNYLKESKFLYTSGMNPVEIGDWYLKYQQPFRMSITNKKGKTVNVGIPYIFIEDDFSSYDSTQGDGAYQVEMAVYNKALSSSNLDQGVINNILINLKEQAKTHGFGRFHEYTVPNTRKSGDQNTSVGNTLVNFFVHYVSLETWNVTHKFKGRIHDYSMLGLGDDNLIAIALDHNYKQEFMAHTENVITSLGLKPKLVSNKYPTYCSSYFMPVEDMFGRKKYVLTPCVTRSLTKLGWSTNLLGTTKPESRMKGNMLGISAYGLCPIMRVLHEYYTKLDVKEDDDGEYRCYSREIPYVLRPSAKTIEWFCDVYHLTEAEVGELESFLKGSVEASGGKPFVWTHTLFRKMF